MWLLECNPEDSPRDRSSPVVDLDGFDQGSLAIEVPVPEDLYEDNFRTVPVATEMDRIHRSVARAVRRMLVLWELYLVTFDRATQWDRKYHGFLYKLVRCDKRYCYCSLRELPGYKPAEDVVRLWREMAEEVRGFQFEILMFEDEVLKIAWQQNGHEQELIGLQLAGEGDESNVIVSVASAFLY
ncbi:hypothetical protein GGI35DRAFT_347164 [Trichoderma velutinum]